MTVENLKQKHDEAWAKLKQFIYESYEPRFYKHKVGRKQEYINGWATLEERDTAEKKIKTLYDTWAQLMKEYWRVTGEHLPVSRIYVEKETPDGRRFFKESTEEADSYQSALRTPQSPRLS